MKKIFILLIPTLLIGFLLVYSIALKKENTLLFEKYSKTQLLLEKAEYELANCKNSSKNN